MLLWKTIENLVFIPYKLIFRNWIWVKTSKLFSNIETYSKRKHFAHFYWNKIYMPILMKSSKKAIVYHENRLGL